MTDFRNLQHYLVQLRASPTAEEYYLEGYSLLRQCTTEAQTILQTPFSGSSGAMTGDPEQERMQLKAYVATPLVPEQIQRTPTQWYESTLDATTTDVRAQDYCRCCCASLSVPEGVPASPCCVTVDQQPQQHPAWPEAECKSSRRTAASRCHTPQCTYIPEPSPPA
jgi:hypothetical protein